MSSKSSRVFIGMEAVSVQDEVEGSAGSGCVFSYTVNVCRVKLSLRPLIFILLFPPTTRRTHARSSQ